MANGDRTVKELMGEMIVQFDLLRVEVHDALIELAATKKINHDAAVEAKAQGDLEATRWRRAIDVVRTSITKRDLAYVMGFGSFLGLEHGWPKLWAWLSTLVAP